MLNAAIVGLGWWGRRMVESTRARSRLLRFSRGITLDLDEAVPFARHHGLKLGACLEDALADPQVQAIVLATPHSLHVSQVLACAAAGKHVFCEKPLAFTRAEALAATEACRAAGVVLGLGHDKRWIGPLRALRTLLREGSLGELLHLEGQYSNDFSSQGLTGAWRQLPDETPAAGLTGPGLHVLDALVDIGGPVQRVAGSLCGRASEGHPADAVALLLEFQAGATGAVTTVRGVPDLFRVNVHGTRGWAEVRGFDTLCVQRTGQAAISDRFAAGDSVFEGLEAFARAVRGGAPFPISTHGMLATVCALEASLAAVQRGQWVAAELPDPESMR